MTYQEQLIREAIAYEAAEAVDSRVVLAAVRKEQRRSGGKVLGIVGLTVAAAAAAVIVPTTIVRTSAEPANLQDRPQHVLLILSDTFREKPRTKSLVLMRVEPDGAVSALEMPSYYNVGPARDDVRNTVGIPVADMATVLRFVVELTGVQPDHYVDVSWDALGRLAEVVGGVDVCIKQPDGSIRNQGDPGNDLPPGQHSLSGELVKRFLDQWLTDSHGLKFDERHRAFLTGFGAKITKANAARLAQEAGESVRVDEGFDLVAFAQRFKGAVPVRTAEIPWEPPTWSRSVYNTAEVHKFVARYFAGEPVAKVHEAPGPGGNGCVY